MKKSESSPGIILISNLFSLKADYGGVCRELARHLHATGWHVTTTSSMQNRLVRPADMLRTIFQKRGQYVLAHMDIFSGMAFRWAETSLWGLKTLHKPVVMTLHGGNLPDFAQQHPGRVRALLQSASAVNAPSNYLLEAMQTYRDDIQLIPNPIYLKDYLFRLRNQPQPRMLYLRALHQLYNPLLAVSVVAELKQDWPDIHLTIVGPDKGDGTVNAVHGAIARHDLVSNATVTGAIPKTQVPYTMQSADIFINPTNFDNTPISVIEAMACGLCIVSTDVGGIPYLLTHDHDALLVPPDNAEAMAAAVRRILTEPGLAQRLSHNARATAEQFDWAAILPQWESLFKNVLSSTYNPLEGI